MISKRYIKEIESLLNSEIIIKYEVLQISFDIACIKLQLSNNKIYIAKFYLNNKHDFNAIKSEYENLLYLNKKFNFFPRVIKFNTEDNDHIHHCVISFTSDWLFPTIENKEIVKILNKEGKKVTFTEIETDMGHDSFLLEVPELYKTISGFLNSNFDKIN